MSADLPTTSETNPSLSSSTSSLSQSGGGSGSSSAGHFDNGGKFGQQLPPGFAQKRDESADKEVESKQGGDKGEFLFAP
jgi:hypothetical protein